MFLSETDVFHILTSSRAPSYGFEGLLIFRVSPLVVIAPARAAEATSSLFR